MEGPVRVGDFVLDPRSGELRGGDAGRQTLSAQPLHVLLALAERPGALVTRDELRARLWPADTFVDFEHGLNAVVKRLRDALGDSADTPRYIETVPRRGYRLVAVVAPVETPLAQGPAEVLLAAPPEAAAVVVPSPAADPPHSSIFRKRMPLLAAGLLTAGAVAAFVYGSRKRDDEAGIGAPPALTAAAPTRLTFGPGLQTDATWSPDGRRIAFAWDRDGNFDIFAQSVEGGGPIRITSSVANETQPAWSPDGTRLVFRSEEDGGGLFSVATTGGAVRRIAGNGFHPAWTPDGHDIVFSSAMTDRLYLVGADGGQAPREILKGQLAGGNWGSFAMHPDGRLGIFGLHPVMGFGFFVSDRAYGTLERVATETQIAVETPPLLSRVHWSGPGDAVFIETATDGVPSIWRAPVDPTTLAWGRPVRLTTGPADAGGAAISPDGTTLAFTNTQSTTRAWVFPFDADRGSPAGQGRAVTDEEATISWLYPSRDGSAIFYAERRPGLKTLRGARTDLSSGETSILVDPVFGAVVPSSSGQRAAYYVKRPPDGESRGGEYYAVAWRDRAGHERLITSWSNAVVHPSDWRHDERAVLATFLERSHTGPAGLVELRVGSSAADAQSRVLLEAPATQFWQGHYSPDGRWVSFVAHSLDRDGPLEAGFAPVSGASANTWTRIAADHAWPDKPRWAPDGRTLYFLSLASGFFNVWGVRVDPERRRVGAAFQVTRFESPRWHIDPDNSTSELGIARGVLTLPMRSVKGSIWLLKMAGT